MTLASSRRRRRNNRTTLSPLGICFLIICTGCAATVVVAICKQSVPAIVTEIPARDNQSGYSEDTKRGSSSSSTSHVCTPGTFSSIDQWASLFPNGTDGFGLNGKAMLAIPVGGKASAAINSMIDRLGTTNYYFVLVTYDDYDWTGMAWYDDVEWIDQPAHPIKWSIAKRFFTPEKVEPYSHFCLWDDDLVPTAEFNGDVFLQWLQQLEGGLDIVQPMIRSNSHGHNYEGTTTYHRPKRSHVHQVGTVEIMAPCYSRKAWSSCIWPNLIEEYSTGWGVDTYLHKNANCGPEALYSVRLALDHTDAKSLKRLSGSGGGGGGGGGAPSYKETGNLHREGYRKFVQESKGWTMREYSRPFRNFQVVVDGSCRVSMTALDNEAIVWRWIHCVLPSFLP